MQRSLRHKTIINAVGHGEVRVTDLVVLTGASSVTIRRDLAELEQLGAIERTHGGARRPAKRGAAMPFGSRWEADRAVKGALARAAAALILDEESVVLDNGTTCYAVARELAGRDLTVLALSLHAAAELGSRPGVRVITPGGPVETDTLALIGSAAVRAARDFRADVAVLGACAADPDEGLTSTSYEDAELKRAMLAGARRRVLVTAASKLTRTASFRFGAPTDLTHLVTTPDAPADVLLAFEEHGVEVTIVPLAP